jgi:hypothetical protein
MPDELPIACSLTAAQLPARLAALAALGSEALCDARQDGTAAELRFAAGVGVRERLEAVVAAELQCCAFLTMRVSDALVLTITAPEGGEAVLAELVDAFRPAA